MICVFILYFTFPVFEACAVLSPKQKNVSRVSRVMCVDNHFQVMAVARARVPVVKMVAPRDQWGPDGRKCKVDISVNNLVAIHNTRLLCHYTEMVSFILVTCDVLDVLRDVAMDCIMAQCFVLRVIFRFSLGYSPASAPVCFCLPRVQVVLCDQG